MRRKAEQNDATCSSKALIQNEPSAWPLAIHIVSRWWTSRQQRPRVSAHRWRDLGRSFRHENSTTLVAQPFPLPDKTTLSTPVCLHWRKIDPSMFSPHTGKKSLDSSPRVGLFQGVTKSRPEEEGQTYTLYTETRFTENKL